MKDAAKLDDFEFLRARVSEHVSNFITAQTPILKGISNDLEPMSAAVRTLLDGGKRLRPAFAYWGWRAVGGSVSDEIVQAVSALEFVQAAALIHDDVIDASATRRGNPSAHEQFKSLHITSKWHGTAAHFGIGAAILLGDLCLTWADEMFYGSPLSPAQLQSGKPFFDIMRTEVMAGQYLDLLEQARQTADIDTIRQVMIHKSAKYTVQRPLHVGASMAGATDAQLESLTGYAIPLGVAFQLRDDVLGVFGDPATTGKPAGDDVREGKRTMLIARTLKACDAAEKKFIVENLGRADLSADDIQQFRNIIISSGALEIVETDIARGRDIALASLNSGGFSEEGVEALTSLAHAATERTQ